MASSFRFLLDKSPLLTVAVDSEVKVGKDLKQFEDESDGNASFEALRCSESNSAAWYTHPETSAVLEETRFGAYCCIPLLVANSSRRCSSVSVL